MFCVLQYLIFWSWSTGWSFWRSRHDRSHTSCRAALNSLSGF
ncbi:hypothetical protein X975_18038, partial [Stegodyphus mimosarum]